MCGICGVVQNHHVSASLAIAGMTDRLAHRGPDNAAVQQSGRAHFGHARLSILDLSSAGHQPMISDDGRYMLTYNGEIYNYRELREALRGEGESFRSRSDSEVLLHALIRWGPGALRRLDGMYAFAFWDEADETLLLARDRLGIKPLYYARTQDALVFGSEVKSILASGEAVDVGIDAAGLHEFMWYGNALGERTLYAGIRRLLPGTYAISRDGEWRVETYWSVSEPVRVDDDLPTATRRIRELLGESVRRQLVSDVPVGVFLSGGIDSSAIAVLAAHELGSALRTYSVGFDFAGGINELPAARRLARALGTQHHELEVKGADLAEVIQRLVESHDQPFGDAANIPLYLLCEQLGDSAKVVLQGDGGDEIFGGYPRYPALATLGRWGPVSEFALKALHRASPYMSDRRRRFVDALAAQDNALRMALLLTQEPSHRPPTDVLSSEWRARVRSTDPFHRYREVQATLPPLDTAQAMLRTDAAILLPDIFLEKVDRATMAHGIEIRVPFLGADLAEYAMGLPSSMKIRRGQTKWLLRRALRGTVPDQILDAPKRGFGVPYEHWLRTTLADFLRSVLTDPKTVRSGMFDSAALGRRMEEHIAGTRDHGFLLWKALQLALWITRAEPSD